MYSKEHPLANGVKDEFLKRDEEEIITANTVTYREKESKGSIKLQSHYAEEEIQKRAGFWGYLMQTIYQVNHQDSDFLSVLKAHNFEFSKCNLLAKCVSSSMVDANCCLLILILLQTCGGAVILTDIVFWCVIVPFLSNTHLGLNMVRVHLFLIVYMLLPQILLQSSLQKFYL